MDGEIDIVVLQVVKHGCFCDLRMGDTFIDLGGNLCCKITDQPNGIDNTCILRARVKDEAETLCWLTGLAPVTQVLLT